MRWTPWWKRRDCNAIRDSRFACRPSIVYFRSLIPHSLADLLLDRVRAAIGDLYDIEAEVGRGAVGVVYAARELRLRRRVAVKVLPPDLAFREDVRTRFLREAEMAAALAHPNIVPIHGVGERAGLVYFVMALVEGESLGRRLPREPRPSVEVVVRILVDVADALAHAHGRGTVHRDIKPDNILLDAASGRAMVTDFGIARAAEGDQRITATGSAIGSPAYMSPEQALGDPGLDGRSDIYSLGVVAYQMLAGEPPFRAASTPAMLMKHVSEMPRPLRDLRADVPGALISAIELAMEKRAEHRWPDAAAFRDALLRAPDATRRPQPPRPPRAPAPTPAPRRPAAPRPTPPVAPATATTTASVWDGGPSGSGETTTPPVASPFSLETPVGEIAANMLAGAGDVLAHAAARVAPSEHAERMSTVLRSEMPKSTARTLSWLLVIGFFVLVIKAGPLLPFFFAIGFLVAMVAGVATPGRLVLRALFGLGVSDINDAFGSAAGARTAYRVPGGLRTAGELRQGTPASVSAQSPQQSLLYGEYVHVVRNATEEKKAIVGAVSALSQEDKALLPPVVPTATALLERVCSIAQALHRMDSTLTPGALEAVDERIAGVRAEPEGAERDRRLTLLERQRESTAGLWRRREDMRTQMDGAMIALMNLKLDMLRLNAEGIGSVLDDVTSATQEARVLSKEIARIVDAAGEVKRL